MGVHTKSNENTKEIYHHEIVHAVLGLVMWCAVYAAYRKSFCGKLSVATRLHIDTIEEMINSYFSLQITV